MPVLGLRGPGQFTVTGQDPEAWREIAFEFFPNGSAPLTALLSKLPSRKEDSSIFHWFENKIPSQRLRVNNAAGYTAAATTLTVDATDASAGISGARLAREGVKLWNERTGERMILTDDPTSDTQIVVKRAAGTTAAAAINDNDWLTVIGTAHEHGASVPTAIQYDPTQYSNYLENFRRPVNIAASLASTHLRTGDEYLRQKKYALRDISIDREMAYLFGELYVDTGAKGQNRYHTRGVVSTISTNASANVIAVDGAITETALFGYLEQVCRYKVSEEKLILGGSEAVLALENMAKGGRISMRDVPTSETYGMRLAEVRSTVGTFFVKSHPLFNMHPVLRQNLLILDLGAIEEVIKKDRDLKFLKDRQNPGDDMITDEYLIESGIMTRLAEAHMYLTGITGFAP